LCHGKGIALWQAHGSATRAFGPLRPGQPARPAAARANTRAPPAATLRRPEFQPAAGSATFDHSSAIAAVGTAQVQAGSPAADFPKQPRVCAGRQGFAVETGRREAAGASAAPGRKILLSKAAAPIARIKAVAR
jgi:hypothetical protein